MAGFNIEKTKKMLKLPYGIEPVAMAGLGYLPPGVQRPERIRKELKKVRRNLRAEIESLGASMKLINIFLMPLLVCLFGVVYAIYQRRKR